MNKNNNITYPQYDSSHHIENEVSNSAREDVFIAKNYKVTSIFQDPYSLMYPFFALKKGCKETKSINVDVTVTGFNGEKIEQKHNILLMPNSAGMPTMADKDIIVYCISKLISAKNQGHKIYRTIEFDIQDFNNTLKKKRGTKGHIGGSMYKQTLDALKRLAGTSIITNFLTKDGTIEYNPHARQDIGWHFVNEFSLTQRSKGAPINVLLELPKWLFSLIDRVKPDVQVVHGTYFNFTSTFRKRLYEIIRKFCGNQTGFRIRLSRLKQKMGSLSTDARFKQEIKAIVDLYNSESVKNGEEEGPIPEYFLDYDAKSDMLIASSRREKSETKLITYKEAMDLAEVGENEIDVFTRIGKAVNPNGSKKYIIMMATKAAYIKEKKAAEIERLKAEKEKKPKEEVEPDSNVEESSSQPVYDTGGPASY